MENKTLAIFGIATYILSVLSSATDSADNPSAPIVLIAISGIATIVFYVMATSRLWKIQKSAAILLLSSAILLVILSVAQNVAPLFLNIVKIINFIAFAWSVSLFWAMSKHKDLAQKYKNITPEIGKDISWTDIVNHIFRVLEFDRNGTTINQNNQVKAKSSFQPYGYLLAESPILNQKVRIPIIHCDDFLLADSIFGQPNLAIMVAEKELLVTYAPKQLIAKGLSGSPHHVLHYAITPRGTLDYYYSKDNDIYMAKPDPQKLIGSFIYEGEIKVQINLKPEF